MFDKILIANRGEIACRITRTAHRLGIKTVAVFSEADADALFVRDADEKVYLGPAPASESYLVIDKIVAACKATGAQAVHPGYGFLSERKAFAEALDAAGIVFIGPPAKAIDAMGDKITSKKLAKEAGVSTVPGHPDAVSDPAEAVRLAAEIGYPVMVKASAGGGGKGMRIAYDPDELQDGLARAQSEALSSFGDDRVFLERFVENPRHIEIQVLADKHGNCVYLGERECSIQRRHQKVLEEAPSPFLDAATRRAMGEQACALARAVGYHSAGTVEFIVDPSRNFFFLEMNTRLQVEHPVTELVTGLDLVEKMIEVAAGKELGFSQDDVKLDGWALEARVYAEEPARGFLPATGRLVRFVPPAREGVRVDTGVVEGDEVTMFYDPMIAKVCTHGATRADAIRRMAQALDDTVLRGIGNNVDFLASLVAHPRFKAGDMSTGFIAEEYGDRFEPAPVTGDLALRFAVVAACMRSLLSYRAQQLSGRLRGMPPFEATSWSVFVGGECIEVGLHLEHDQIWNVQAGGRAHRVRLHWRPGQVRFDAIIDGDPYTFQADRISEGFLLRHGGFQAPTLIRTHRAQELASRMRPKPKADLSGIVIAPMPGLIKSVRVAVGDEVKLGQELLILEAMKMENVVRAERDGVVATVAVGAGDTVAADAVLVTLQ
ncbi:MAG: acetyl/propionyl/methylcrotonyl-CoA carboxylase subunit alpha [Geminicoccaceae bacterium]|nr:MAG: acetyl/propionyl/methylcrotonyl-CoA carboxylase subunit alpha [Geminicoccaceae bacterium]